MRERLPTVITGLAADQAALARWLRGLERMPRVASIELTELRRPAPPANKRRRGAGTEPAPGDAAIPLEFMAELEYVAAPGEHAHHPADSLAGRVSSEGEAN